jgi:hypothetical protein
MATFEVCRLRARNLAAHFTARAARGACARRAAVGHRCVCRGQFGHRDTQSIFNDDLAILERRYQIGASHFDVSQILRERTVRIDGNH